MINHTHTYSLPDPAVMPDRKCVLGQHLSKQVLRVWYLVLSFFIGCSTVALADERWDARRAFLDAGPTSADYSVPPNALHVGRGQTYSTLNAAIRAAIAGDTIVVHAGVYREVLGGAPDAPNGGYVGKRLVIQAAPGAKPVVTGADVFSNWQAAGDGLWFTSFSSPFPEPSPETITRNQIDPAHPFAGNLEQVFADNRVLTQVGGVDSVRGNDRRFYYDSGRKRIYVGSNPFARRIEISVRPRASLLAGAGTIIRGLHFTRYSPTHQDGKAALVVDNDNILLEDVTVTNSAASGIMVSGDNVTLRRVSARFNGALGIQATRSNRFRLEFSRIDNNNIESFDYRDCGSGAYCVLAGMKMTHSRDVVIRYNTFNQNQSTGFWCDLNCADVQILGNHVAGNKKHGIYYEVSHNGWIVSNVVTGHRAARAAAVKISGSANVTVHRNTLFDNYNQIIFASDPRNEWPTPNSDISNLDIRANVFAESSELTSGNDQYILQPINFGGTPLPDRLRYFYKNVYLLANNQQQRVKPRFLWENEQAFSLPREFFEATNYRYGSAAQQRLTDQPNKAFVQTSVSDFRLVSNLSGLNYNGGVNIPGSVIGRQRLFPSTVSQARYQNGLGALFVENDSPDATLSVEPLSVDESVSVAMVPIRLSRALNVPITIVAFTQIASASPGIDYYGRTARLDYAPGQTVRRFAVTVLDDSVAENAERVVVRLAVKVGADSISVARDRAYLTINDNDR